MKPMSPDHSKLRIALIDKLCLYRYSTVRDNQIVEAAEAVIKERGVVQGTINGLKQLLELPESAGLTELFNAVEALELNKSERDTLRKAYNSNAKDWRELCGYFNLPVSTLSDVLSAIDTMRKERDALRDRPDATQPQLSEIRYVLHGDIQPCSVLYSDDTTTLLRLDEGDIMCETDTIEWSDSVTYRCQELLKGESKRSNIPVTLSPVKLLAQLVRDERILLNDNGDDETVETNPNAETLEAIGKIFVDALSPEQPCVECSHVFDADSMTCPICITIRPPKQHPTAPGYEWPHSNSPMPLR